MKYIIIYSRKVRVKAYESMEIGLHMEYDERTKPQDAFPQVRDHVEEWIAQERDRILAEHGERPGRE